MCSKKNDLPFKGTKRKLKEILYILTSFLPRENTSSSPFSVLPRRNRLTRSRSNKKNKKIFLQPPQLLKTPSKLSLLPLSSSFLRFFHLCFAQRNKSEKKIPRTQYITPALRILHTFCYVPSSPVLLYQFPSVTPPQYFGINFSKESHNNKKNPSNQFPIH